MLNAIILLYNGNIYVNIDDMNMMPEMSVSVGLPLERQSVFWILTGGVKEDVMRFGEI